MGRKERKDTSQLRDMMEAYGVKIMEDAHHFIKMLTADTDGKEFSADFGTFDDLFWQQG